MSEQSGTQFRDPSQGESQSEKDGEVGGTQLQKKDSKLPRHAILQRLRAHIERCHRDNLFRHLRFFGPPCSLPIYIWPDRSLSYGFLQLLPIALHNYLYRTWSSESKRTPLVRHCSPPMNPVKVARVAASVSSALCARVEATQRKILERPNRTYDEMEALRVELGREYWQPIQDHKFLLLQPLFRALAIVIKSADYNTSVPAIAEIPVLIVLRGVEDGLSAPITFNSIADRIRVCHQAGDAIQVAETSLATAVNFAIDLENREVAALGPRPDPAETGKDPRRSCFLAPGEALMLVQCDGWEGEEAPEGPSSSWVDLDVYPHWTGGGAKYDQTLAEAWEVRCRKVAAAAERGEDPYDPLAQSHSAACK
ncbi:hypothetical protein NEMBOFW57_009257 [Staphylotrichum longicolle]|uniref:Uncharacterized protein n=1 Tax=Staphylotrichum longicolle TaxID=669026 RepID=A0AAD4EP32_9PEZI|nr:hypothetical protein NEMBOFW57_009257 [Staphylotrichum longicolle]